jgi:phytoene/squalene synthetase
MSDNFRQLMAFQTERALQTYDEAMACCPPQTARRSVPA